MLSPVHSTDTSIYLDCDIDQIKYIVFTNFEQNHAQFLTFLFLCYARIIFCVIILLTIVFNVLSSQILMAQPSIDLHDGWVCKNIRDVKVNEKDISLSTYSIDDWPLSSIHLIW